MLVSRADDVGRLLISCPDRPGIVAAVSRFLFECGANIANSAQHSTGGEQPVFFMRVEFELGDLATRVSALQTAFGNVAEQFGMSWRLTQAAERKRLAVFVSRAEHALLELLWAQRAGDLAADICLVVSNHPDTQALVTGLGIPFVHVPVERGRKSEAEAQQLEQVVAHGADTIVLARYMQILSPLFLSSFGGRVINIHHSFLPAFVGANPYLAAYDRGVKLIGATAHYVTEELDAGPIIEQDVARVDHRQGADDLRRLGRYLERIVLVRAVKWHVEDRVLVHGGKTIIFS